MHITGPARKFLTSFWLSHPSLRRKCVEKYGYDPIEDETNYWIYGIAESDHKDILNQIKKSKNTFSLYLAKMWALEEVK